MGIRTFIFTLKDVKRLNTTYVHYVHDYLHMYTLFDSKWQIRHLSLVSLAASLQPDAPASNVASSPQPIPLGEVGLRRFCKPDGGRGLKSVGSGDFTIHRQDLERRFLERHNLERHNLERHNLECDSS